MIKRLLFISLAVISPFVNAQEAKEKAVKKKHREASYLAAHVGYSYSLLGGLEGQELGLYWDDYIQDLNNNGIAADGGLTGRHSPVFGVSYTQFVSRRFAIPFHLDYWQIGYREKINASGETETGGIERAKDFRLNLNYLHIQTGLKYYNDFGLTLTLGGFVNYNTRDKVRDKEDLILSGRFGSQSLSKDSVKFVHEHFNENRVIFLTGGFFSVGYKWNSFEIDASYKITGSFLSETDDQFFRVYQLGFRYKIPLRKEEE